MNDTDLEKFLEYIVRAKEKHDFYLLAYIQDEGAGGEQGGDKDRDDDEGEQEDKRSGKEANFYFIKLGSGRINQLK